jgi:uncharacterized protein YjbI with pentapeptide repeats
MGLTRKGVVSLWSEPDRLVKAHQIIDYLLNGNIDEVKNLTDKIDGKHDLRGFDFSLREQDIPFMNYEATGVGGFPKANENHFKNITLEGFDCSGSLFSNSRWENCEFRDIVFNNADFYASSFGGCSFRNVRFKDCWLENLILGRSTEKNLGLFSEVQFIKGTFSRVTFGFPRFENCTFACDIKRTNFHGSQFYNCKFTGTLSGVLFWGEASPDKGFSNEEIFMPEEQIFKNQAIPHNPMTKVDFSKARFKPSLDSVGFPERTDLSDTILPIKGGVFLVNDGPKVFSEMIRRIESEWQGPNEALAIKLADGYARDKRYYGLGQVVINPERMQKLDGEDFAKAFIKLLKQVMEDG